LPGQGYDMTRVGLAVRRIPASEYSVSILKWYRADWFDTASTGIGAKGVDRLLAFAVKLPSEHVF
jgi:hypothetical protein